MIRMTDPKSVAEALHTRYEPIRAVASGGATGVGGLILTLDVIV